MLNERRLSEKMINESVVNSIRNLVDSTINMRLAPVIEVLEKSMPILISEEDAFEILNVSHSTFVYYSLVGLLSGSAALGTGVSVRRYKLSEVLALIKS